MRHSHASLFAVHVCSTLLACACAASVGGQSETSPERTHDITVDDYFTQGFISDMRISPDGSAVAYIEGRWDEGLDRRNMDLWVVDVESTRRTRLTFDEAGESSPRFSPDGAWVYFLSSQKRGDAEHPPYNGQRQVWRMAATGGEPFAVTRADKGVVSYELSADGDTVYFAVGKENVEKDAWKSLRETYKDLTYGHGVVDFSQIRALDLDSWRERTLIDEQRVIAEFAVSPDEQHIAMITTPTEELISMEGWSHVDVWHAATDEVQRLDDTLFRADAPSPYGWILGLNWSSDSAKLCFRVDFDGYPGMILVSHFDNHAQGNAQGRVTGITRPDGEDGVKVSAEGRMEWMPDSHDLCIIAEDHARARLYRITEISTTGQGDTITMTPGDVVIEQFSIAANRSRLVVLKAGLAHTPDIFAMTPDDPAVYARITNINPQVDTWKLPQIRIVRWRSFDGTEVEGILELPTGWKKEDGPLPLHVSIHGGPTSSSKLNFKYWIYGRAIFAANGWAVFDPNYRGSTGYGDSFLTDLINNKNNLDVQDILSGVDMLIADGIADPKKLAVSGWSNGGYLTNCLITATDRFKAASSGAGVFDTVMQWSIEDTPGHVVNFNSGLPWDRAAQMHKSSPLYNANKITTPTLIHVGENDARVPAAHSIAMHRALHHYVGTPTELIIYPGEGHGLTRMSHRRAKLEWDLKWFEHYVLGKSAADSEDEGNVDNDE
jgi:dipeptidyl aminopeptidase/acylaminoacyl peptidase